MCVHTHARFVGWREKGEWFPFCGLVSTLLEEFPSKEILSRSLFAQFRMEPFIFGKVSKENSSFSLWSKCLCRPLKLPRE